MDPLFNHSPPSPSVFPPAAPSFPFPTSVFPTTLPMLPQQVPLGEFVPPTTTLPPVVHADPTPTLNPTTTFSTHPPYAQMITEAIEALKERDGSSRQAIAKYIERIYSNLPANHSNLLTHHLKRMKDSGQLVMVKHSYVLAGSAPEVLANLSVSVPKKSPGRPPKLTPVVNSVPAQQSPVQQFLSQQAPIDAMVGPGTVTVPEAVFASIGLVDGVPDAAPLPKRRPGRPKKFVDAAGGATGQPVTEGSGIAPASQLMTEVAGVPVKRRLGRPARKGSVNVGPAVPGTRPRGRGRPKRNAGVYTGKPRGRPRRNVESPMPVNAVAGGAEGVPTAAYAGDGAVPVGRKRGRPGRLTRSVNEPKKPRNLSGRPLGRPKKNAPAAAVQVSNLQLLLAYQELKSKLEFFQSRIKHNVGILKPVLNSQTATGALQELEELATLDVTAASSLHGLQLPPQNQA